MKFVDISGLNLKESPVFSIESSEAFTVDIEVEGVHHYILENGIVSHNSSIIADVVSNGIEPVFQFEYKRTRIVDEWPDGLTTENVKDYLTETKQGDASVWRGEYGGVSYLFEPHNRGLCIVDRVRDYGYQWVMDNYPDDIKNKSSYLVTTDDIKIDDHVAIQVATQSNINQSCSKTANIPNDYPYEDFKQLYYNAWKAGLNGFTSFRSGTMEEVLSKIDKKEEEQDQYIINHDIKLPQEFVNGTTKIIKRENKKFYINFSYLPEDSDLRHPIAMWIHTNQKGETVAANAAVRALSKLLKDFGISEELIEKQRAKITEDPSHYRVSKMVSMCLRHNLPLSSIVTSLENLEEDYISSLLTCVRKFLSEKIPNGTKISGKTCPSCNSVNLVYQSGCASCSDCGFSGCG